MTTTRRVTKSYQDYMMKYVPYQLCPKCEGVGSLRNPNMGNTSSVLVVTCDVCHGAKIIPMCPVRE